MRRGWIFLIVPTVALAQGVVTSPPDPTLMKAAPEAVQAAPDGVQALARLTQVQSVLDILAHASFYFLVATVVLAFLTAMLLEAARDFGVRSFFNGWLIRRWAPWDSHGLRKYGLTGAMLGLQPDDLAGQVAAILRRQVLRGDAIGLHFWLEQRVPEVPSSEFADTPTPRADEAAEQLRMSALAARLDIAIDQLQLRLRLQQKWLTLVLAFYVTLLLTSAFLIGVRIDFRTTPVIGAVAISAAIATPILRDLFRAAIRAA